MVFVPIHDTNTLKYIGFQRVTLGLILTNTAVFLWQLSLGAKQSVALAVIAGVTPSSLMGGAPLPPEVSLLPPWLTLITYMFLHGSWMHLIANMIFLWVFGDNVEDALGHAKFLFFYLACGVAAGLTHALMESSSQAPMIGASGATAGIIGAYLLLYPKVKVWVLLLLRIPVRLPAYWILAFWLGFQIYFMFSSSDPTTAWWAHMGGFVAGIVLVVFLKRPEIPLWGPKSEENSTS